MATSSQLHFNNTFARLGKQFYTRLPPQPLMQPYLVSASERVAALIGLDSRELATKDFVRYFSGEKLLPGSEPLAMVYSGHQFGVYNPRLGDGRAILLGEVDSEQGHYDLVIKGAGQTPYSRFGDGRAVLRSSIREYLCSEAMAGLGIPTTRALCVIGGADRIEREETEPGAVIVRVSESHVRFGSFEWFYYQNDHESLRRLADYVIAQHYPALLQYNPGDRYAHFYAEVVKRTAQLIACWQAVGFAHGVMNTDNMSIIGLTFDYGPFGFLDDFEPGFICNHSDHSGRYAFNQQPHIGLWNLNALAHVLTPLAEKQLLIDILNGYEKHFIEHYTQLLRNKLGLVRAEAGDEQLMQDWLELMASEQVDHTNTWRALSHSALETSRYPVANQFRNKTRFADWFNRWLARLQQQTTTDAERQQLMKANNPKYILRNYLAQHAIEQAQVYRDFSEVNRLLQLLYKPFDEQPEFERYAAVPPESGKHLEISCSS